MAFHLKEHNHRDLSQNGVRHANFFCDRKNTLNQLFSTSGLQSFLGGEELHIRFTITLMKQQGNQFMVGGHTT